VIRHLGLAAGDEKDVLQATLEQQLAAVKEVVRACDAKRFK
jgi:hypothetical protein